jgi:hypothetical protein
VGELATVKLIGLFFGIEKTARHPSADGLHSARRLFRLDKISATITGSARPHLSSGGAMVKVRWVLGEGGNLPNTESKFVMNAIHLQRSSKSEFVMATRFAALIKDWPFV